LSILLPAISTVTGDGDTPDIADIYRDFSVSVSGIETTSSPDLSVAASIATAHGACLEFRNPSYIYDFKAEIQGMGNRSWQ